jgi:hypothetical protein
MRRIRDLYRGQGAQGALDGVQAHNESSVGSKVWAGRYVLAGLLK